MPTLSEKLFAEAYAQGKTPDTKRVTSAFARGVARAGIVRSTDFKRIEYLPRRDWELNPELESLRKELTRALRVRGGSMELWSQQAAALAELCEWKGLFAPLGAGSGKTIVSILAPWMVGSKRPLLLVPAALRDQTLRKVVPEMSKHWKIPHNLRILAYSELSLAKNAEILSRIQPDLIISDEAHMIAAEKSGRTRRVRRYMNEFPETMFVTMSGTITRRSIRDYWQLAMWSLKEDLVPLPTTWRELQDWSDALDEGIEPTRIVAPGALMRLCGTTIDEETGKERRESPREGYRRRLVQTPGVIATRETEVGASLIIQATAFKVPGKVKTLIEEMRKEWETPNGDYIVNAIELWRHGRELSMGMWLKWDPRPPDKWMDARKAWKSFVRETISNNRRGLDTELQVWTECEGLEQKPLEFLKWKEVKGEFKINTVVVWEDYDLVNDVVERLKHQPTIAWVEHPAVGVKLQQLSGLHYYGAGDGAIIDEPGTRSCIASIKAHATGKNLQMFSHNIIVSCPPSGAAVEQLLARTHRPGQKADDVHFETYLHTEELVNGFRQAQSDAIYIEQTTGQRQRLSYATLLGI